MPKMVQCVKLNQELPGLDEETGAGRSAIKYAQMIGGKPLADRVRDQVSAMAWKMWIDHQVMVVNEYRLDPTSDDANAILREHMEAFFFGAQKDIDNYVAPQ